MPKLMFSHTASESGDQMSARVLAVKCLLSRGLMHAAADESLFSGRVSGTTRLSGNKVAFSFDRLRQVTC